MATEIERKFLVSSDGWRRQAHASHDIEQGYLHLDDNAEIRVRIRDDEAMLTVKRGGAHLERLEVEVPLATDAARQLLAEAVVGHRIAKRRHLVDLGELTAEVDEFRGDHFGLVLAEVELPAADTPMPQATWLGEEVTGDPRYYNATLARAQ